MLTTTVAITLLFRWLLGIVSSTAIGGMIPGYVHGSAHAPAQLEDWTRLFAHGTTRR